jgi:hypothetical protein
MAEFFNYCVLILEAQLGQSTLQRPAEDRKWDQVDSGTLLQGVSI